MITRAELRGWDNKATITNMYLTLTYKALHDEAPGYLKDLIKLYSKSRNLRSNSQFLHEILKCCVT